MDQTNKKQSRIVKVGDRLEDATVAHVADHEVTLREADGSIVRVQRLDAMAALLQSSHTNPLARGTVPGSTGPAPTPAASPNGTGPLTAAPFGQVAPQPSAATAAADTSSSGGQGGGRRGRRFQPLDGAGNPGG
jgi:hypothetical protein